MTDRTAPPVRVSPAAALVAAALGALTLWAFWPALREMAGKWLRDPQYTHGYLVPLFSAYLLWARRGRLAGATLAPSWWGLLPLAAAAILRYEAALNYDYLDGLALVVTAAGLFLLAGGPRALAWAWPAVAFLLFMVPLPHFVETGVAQPLQRVATVGSAYALQTLGLPAVAEGNRINLSSEPPLEVARACSGLSMLLIFFALSTAMAVLVRRPLFDRLVILASAAPIAIVANVFRITATGLAREAFGLEAAEKVFHDWAGWMMMPLALALLWAELGVLSLILRESPDGGGRVPLSFEHPLAAAPDQDRIRAEAPPAAPKPVPPAGAAPFAAAGS